METLFTMPESSSLTNKTEANTQNDVLINVLWYQEILQDLTFSP